MGWPHEPAYHAHRGPGRPRATGVLGVGPGEQGPVRPAPVLVLGLWCGHGIPGGGDGAGCERQRSGSAQEQREEGTEEMGRGGKEVRTTTSLFSCLRNPSFPFLVASFPLPPAPLPLPGPPSLSCCPSLGPTPGERRRWERGRPGTADAAGREDMPSFASSQGKETLQSAGTRVPFFKEAPPWASRFWRLTENLLGCSSS